MKQDFLEAGKVRNTHALRGEVKFECWLDGQKPLNGVEFLYLSKKEEKKMKIRSIRVQGDVFLIGFEGIDTVEDAVGLKGKTLYAARKELDPKGDKVFFADLIGLPLIEEESGTVYGTVREVTNRGASELFLVALPDGREVYFPAVKEFMGKARSRKRYFRSCTERNFRLMAPIRFDIMTLFPELVDTVLSESIIGRARRAELLDIRTHNIRDYSKDKFRRVDDTPYGGGKGMLMKPDPICDCFDAITEGLAHKPYTIYMSPKGTVFTRNKAKELSKLEHIVILCGHYEGVDQRAIDEIVDEEISIGDYVLTGGEIPATVLVDAVARLRDGVLADPECHEKESHSEPLLEYPQYTRPYEFRGKRVPDVLISGHHENIEKWRREMALKLTEEKRPDLLKSSGEE